MESLTPIQCRIINVLVGNFNGTPKYDLRKIAGGQQKSSVVIDSKGAKIGRYWMVAMKFLTLRIRKLWLESRIKQGQFDRTLSLKLDQTILQMEKENEKS